MQNITKVTEELGNELTLSYPISLTFRYDAMFQVQEIRKIIV